MIGFLKVEKSNKAKTDYGGNMEIERMDDGILCFYVDEKYLKKYGLEIETFSKGKPFKVNIFDSLLYKAEKETV